MSANNFVQIKQQDNGQYRIDECDADSGQRIMGIGDATSALEALEMAQDYINDPDNEVEYGISYSKPTPIENKQ